MTKCVVLRCPEAPSDQYEIVPDSGIVRPICTPHKDAINGGARWMLDSDLGIPDESGIPQPGLTILMGNDLPSRLISLGMQRQEIGSEEGMLVNLIHETSGGEKTTKIWVSAEHEARIIAMFTSPPDSQ